jgi:Putative amidoligase enzyme
MTIYEDFGIELANEDCAEADYFICGTEYEIEDVHVVKIKKFDIGTDNPYWFGDLGAIKDGSLRNNGIEFVTRPVPFKRALELFDELHGALELGPEPYTARTSTHVHVNVASMSKEQLKLFVLLYALFEPVFFAYAGPARKHNIHCVPLSFTLLPKHYPGKIEYLIDAWSKYTAFNLKPVRTIGTVEFRHLFGTGDKQVYQQWLQMIRDLWTFSFNMPLNWLQKQLIAGTTPQTMLSQVIPSASLSNYTLDFTDSLIDVKLAFVS